MSFTSSSEDGLHISLPTLLASADTLKAPVVRIIGDLLEGPVLILFLQTLIPRL